MTIRLTEQEFNDLFTQYPQVRKAENGQPECPYCGNGFTAAGLNYWNSVTDAGTDFCEIEIRCDVCDRVMWRGGSWYPRIEDERELSDFAEFILKHEMIDYCFMLGDWIRNARLEAKLTQKQLSEATGVSVYQISNIEHGNHHRRKDMVNRLCKELSVKGEYGGES